MYIILYMSIYICVCIYVYMSVCVEKYLRVMYLDSMYPSGLLPKLFFQLIAYVKADEEKNNL